MICECGTPLTGRRRVCADCARKRQNAHWMRWVSKPGNRAVHQQSARDWAKYKRKKTPQHPSASNQERKPDLGMKSGPAGPP